ncbi:DUF6069 family protein [Candidatus Nephthysia bennettiae]|uniref:Uncharacterized protein n=1 Tax=Candidatus Nephthysia bennettiae TaxID=3127016 RepID=A0A934K5P6_9BACT|nr:hypothetical protein [Candidatus Dormibacteraeota bacterium]MBJ7613294.1 hypothetical protein [Candidatus Dormibacteraeota bacterium]
MATRIHGLYGGRRLAEGAGQSDRLSLRRLVVVGAALAAVATAADLILAMVLRRALEVPLGFSPLTAPSVASMTIVGMIGATAVFGWIARVRPDPRATFVRIALVALVLSWVPDLVIWVTGVFSATTGTGIFTLMTLHVVAAACAVGILYRFGLAAE